jgi:SAM-dependent methyltransferase
MKRVPEPELMDTEEQADAYAAADFSAAHQSYVTLFAELFPDRPAKARVLDLGCGPADVTIRFAKANPGYIFHAVDGSAAMLSHARRALRSQPRLRKRVKLIAGYVPGAPFPLEHYDVILSNNFLHHLHDPQVLWRCVRSCATRGTLLFVTDLLRPASRSQATALVRRYARSEPPILKRDFFNSLLASFTPAEIAGQLTHAGLQRLRIRVISDRHLAIFGECPKPG